ncbi:hypothetical protein [Nitrosovibrio sp. Nv4]|uniref:hypothetical protein n=1 Tax=Nitrosovibrio sp. Nv4 TaxID=1945880 RepID=UPI000BD4A26C|nr:hypothetical protein [Nitrosovibrio sp. Nv4]SOD42374.1 hypothetical protein SAMN06298226_2713 [Nitrosovibrio sp. Nv4]
MATFSATDLNTKPMHMGGYGNMALAWGSVTPTAGALADVYKPLRIPAGMTLTGLEIVNDDLDSNATPLMACKIGYEPVNSTDGPTADDDYFVAAGSTILRSAARTSMNFQPVKFEKDVWVTVTLTAAAATFASGKVTAIATGEATGVK